MDIAIPEGMKPKHVPAPVSQLIALEAKGLSYTDIGILTGTSGQAVKERLVRHGYKPKTQKAFDDHEKGLAALRRSQLLESMTPDKIEKASLKDTAITYGILKDKQAAQQAGPNSLSAVVEMIHKDGATAARVTVSTDSQAESTGGTGGLPASGDVE